MKYLKLKNKIKVLEGKNELLEFSNYRLEEEIKRLEYVANRIKDFNKELTQKIASLRNELKEKEPISFNISMDKESVDDIIKKVTENVLGKQQHECTPECFGKHVIKTLQKDYDSCLKKAKPYFLMYWYDNLSAFYPWLEKLYIIDEKIYFKSKESSI